MIDVIVKSRKKGSNPGGMCNVLFPGASEATIFTSYFKYVNTSHLPKGIALYSKNQPVYEAITCALLRFFGLRTIEDTILDNRENAVGFTQLPKVSGKINMKRPFYFVSKLVEGDESTDSDVAISSLSREKIYRDFLLIADISGRRQNVWFPKDRSGVIYLDVGCSFVDAHEGTITQRERVARLNLEKKVLKRAIKKLEKRTLTTNTGSTVCLAEMIRKIPEMTLSVDRRKTVPLSKLVSEEEIRHISNVYTAHFTSQIITYKNDARLERKK